MKSTLLKQLADPFEQLLGKAQVSILRACPPVCGMVVDGAFQEHQSRFKSLLPMAAQVPHALHLHWRDKREKRVALGQVVFGITTRCTLNCDKCLSYISDLTDHSDVPTAELLADIQALFSCADYVYDFCLGGGEPMLHPGLDQIIRACAATGKVGNIKVMTNGTVLPDAKVLAALRDTKACVSINHYPNASQPDLEKIKAIFTKNKIRYHVLVTIRDRWVDKGKFGQLQEGSPVRRFSDCFFRMYYVYMSGQLHLCCQSAVLMSHGMIPDCDEDYIDTRSVNPAAFRDKLKKLNKRSAISACSYCLGNNYKSPKVPAAVQRPK